MARVRDEESFQKKREQILAVATQCFVESGFHGTGMAKVCQAAGMSAGALYRYYPSKESIIETIIERDRKDTLFLLERLDKAKNKVTGLADMMAEAVQLLAADQDYCQLCVEISAEAARNPTMAQLLSAAEYELLNGLTAIITQGQSAGQITSALDPDVTAQLLITFVDGFIGQFAIKTDLNVTLLAQYARQSVLNLLSE
ncbi:MAG: TetR/AcrR family transcriptional regulator [Phormidesmis sp.]